jgi:hypothetical protein
MSERSDILSHIKEVHDITPGEPRVRARLPFGLLSTAETRWAVQGEGEADTRYSLEVTEYERRGRLASLFRSEPDITAKLLIMSPEPSAVYIASMAADGSTTFMGAVRPAVAPEDSRMRDTQPVSIPPQEARMGFDASLHDARFAA